MKRCLILVEGQTEEIFVNSLLRDHLQVCGIWPTPTLLTTKRVKDGPNFKGGIRRYASVKPQIQNLLRDKDAAAVTTLFDYYGLPEDFPGRADARTRGSALERVQCLESAMSRDIDDSRFIPHVVLHELEAWIFSDIQACHNVFPKAIIGQLMLIRSSSMGPEDINDGSETAPSKRIFRCYQDYIKTITGPQALRAIGISKIRCECPHFDAWLSRLESL